MPSRQAMWDRLDGEFDAVIVGGGINGAGIARDAARRGLRVAVVEQRDLAWGTSSRSSKLVHGGLRYLEQFQIGLVFESVSERRVLMRLAPHLVLPLGFLFPVYAGAKRPMFIVTAGMFLYDALSLFRSPGRRRTLRVRQLEGEEPALGRTALRGAPLYYDCATDDARLTLETAIDAAAHDATIVTYAKATGVERDGNGRITHLNVACTLTGQTRSVRTGVVINASGPWSDRLLGSWHADHRPILRPTKGCHIVVSASVLPLKHAVVMSHPDDNRVLFAIPWGDSTYIGTTDTDYKGDPTDVNTDSDDVAYLIDSAARYFPDHPIRPEDVISTWAGLRPLFGPPQGAGPVNESAVSREHHIWTTDDGVVSVAGGKLTTYRLMSAEVVDAAVAWLTKQGGLSKPLQAAKTGTTPLPGAEGWKERHATLVSDTAAAGAGALSDATVQLLVATYGTRAPAVAALAAADAELAEPIVAGRPEILAQVAWGVREEFLTTVTDALKQRTQLYYRDANQGLDGIPKVCAWMARELGWDAATCATQSAAYEQEVAESRAWRPGYEAASQKRRDRRQMLVPAKAS